MQPTSVRLSQALWTAFQAAKPVHRKSSCDRTLCANNKILTPTWQRPISHILFQHHVRFYGDAPKPSEIEKKAQDAKRRIDESIESRAETAQDAEPSLKPEKEETIVHTLPESSSIVYEKDPPSGPGSATEPKQDPTNSESDANPAYNRYKEWASSRWQSSPLPSQIASLRSRASTRFSAFMDNLQSNIVVAAHHINDLTGYTGIERLKREIEAQETAVKDARSLVKSTRDKYSEAIAMRSTTQREVNDLLHRKHAWSPTDLERFTHLYRSDHANEQAEVKTQQDLSNAEVQYEEASTKLAKSILARYHEEQIWSDKIRQMSTWGTWGLMGINVLLFIIFQIAIEPWRRRRLVKGFEEKVQKALDEKDQATNERIAALQLRIQERNGNEVVQAAVEKQPEGLVATAAEQIAEAVADAVSGATDETEQPSSSSSPPDTATIEAAAEQVTATELQRGGGDDPQPLALVAETIEPVSQTEPQADPKDPPASASDPVSWRTTLTTAYHNALRASTDAYAHHTAAAARQFDDREHIVLSRREVTGKVLEGFAAGVAFTCGVAYLVARAR